MFKSRSLNLVLAFFLVMTMAAPLCFAQNGKIGYVDLRKAFYEYEKTKTMEQELNTLTEDRQATRTKMIGSITKLRDEAELLDGKGKAQKQSQIEKQLAELQEFDRETRQQLLNKKNDMFRQVIEDIQKVVNNIGQNQGFDYVMDSRNIMYAKPEYDLTDAVVKQLNK